MIQGFNSDIKFKGIIYHIQTEDKGINNPRIETIVYKKGVVLSTTRLNYEDILSSNCMVEVITSLMKTQHDQAIEAVKEGAFFDDEDTDVSILKKRVKESFEQMIAKYKHVTEEK